LSSGVLPASRSTSGDASIDLIGRRTPATSVPGMQLCPRGRRPANRIRIHCQLLREIHLSFARCFSAASRWEQLGDQEPNTEKTVHVGFRLLTYLYYTLKSTFLQRNNMARGLVDLLQCACGGCSWTALCVCAVNMREYLPSKRAAVRCLLDTFPMRPPLPRCQTLEA
jgi:hypothetical protein